MLCDNISIEHKKRYDDFLKAHEDSIRACYDGNHKNLSFFSILGARSKKAECYCGHLNLEKVWLFQ